MKRFLFGLAVFSLAILVATQAMAQTYANRFGKLVLGGNGGTDLTNTLTLLTSGSGWTTGAKTYVFPLPGTGIFHSDGSGTLTLGAINLASGDVTGILPPANGGTGVNNGTNTITITGGNVSITGPFSGTPVASSGTLTANRVVTTDGTGKLQTTDLANGQLLIGNANSFTAATLTGTANQITVTNGTGTITLATPQSIGTASTPTFGGLTLSNLTAQPGVVHNSSGGVLSSGAVALGTEVSGTLLPTNGGTGVSNSNSNTITLGGPIVTANSFSTAGNFPLTLTTTGTTNITLPTSGTLIASAGALTNNGVVSTNGSGNLVSTALTNGQILIGSTGAAPVAATLTAGSNITITNGGGTITIASTASGSGTGSSIYTAPFTVVAATGSSGTTLVDAGLNFPVAANEVWVFEAFLSCKGGVAAQGMNVAISFTSGTLEATSFGYKDGSPYHAGSFRHTTSGQTSNIAYLSDASLEGIIRISGLIDNTGGSAENVKIQFASAGTTDATTANACRVYKGSYLVATKTTTQAAGSTTTYTSSTTWVVPTGIYAINVEGIGGAGGGGGGGADATNAANTRSGGGGGGGGAGEYIAARTVSVVPGETLTISIGAAGTAGAAGVGNTNTAATNGGNGGTTTVVGSTSGTLLSANGGTGGTAGTNAVGASGTGGALGAGGVVAGSSPAGGTAGNSGTAGGNGANGVAGTAGNGGSGPTGGNANTGGAGGAGALGVTGVFVNGNAGNAGTGGYVTISY
ncbi:MAG: hypothetical protein JSS75_00190 [Bacteroidetes bacterium]|nr:hypothetical protein [Bacteroidota bacterium]